MIRGTASPEALIGRALELGYPALALTDRDNLYLAIRFWQAARADGLTPLLGVELSERAGVAKSARPDPASPGAPTLLIALDRRGYANLCALISARKLDPHFDLVAALEGAGAITYRQMAARVLNISMDARADGESGLATALEGVAKGFAGQGGGLSIELLKAARSLREDDAMGDIPMRPTDE